MSTFSPPPLLVSGFSHGWRISSSCQIGSGPDSVRTDHVCISVCISHATQSSLIQSSSQSLRQQVLATQPFFPCPLLKAGRGQIRMTNCNQIVSLWSTTWGRWLCVCGVCVYRREIKSSKPERRMRHAALITILIFQSVSEADSLFISNFTAVSSSLVAWKKTTTIISFQYKLQ